MNININKNLNIMFKEFNNISNNDKLLYTSKSQQHYNFNNESSISSIDQSNLSQNIHRQHITL